MISKLYRASWQRTDKVEYIVGLFSIGTKLIRSSISTLASDETEATKIIDSTLSIMGLDRSSLLRYKMEEVDIDEDAVAAFHEFIDDYIARGRSGFRK